MQKLKLVTSLFALIITASILFTSCKKDRNELGNEVRISIIGEPDVLNPVIRGNAYATQIYKHIFLPLLDFNPENLQLSPVLAKNLPIIMPIDTGKYKGGTALIYEILDEATWDDGKPVTANDYIFTIKAIMNPKVNANKLRGYLAFIKDIRIDPANVKKFTILTNERYILAEDASGSFGGILPEHLYDPKGWLKNISLSEMGDAPKAETLEAFAKEFSTPKYNREKEGVSGCGAYSLEEWQSQQFVRLRKKQNWWGDKLADKNPMLRAKPEKLTYRFIKDEAAILSELKNNNLDVNATMTVTNFLQAKNDAKLQENYNFYAPNVAQYSYIGLNTDNPKLSDKRVRRALAHLVNVDEIIKTVQHGLASRLNTPFLPSKKYYAANLVAIDFNIEKAKTLLAEAGWKDSDNNGVLDKKIGKTFTELNLQVLTPNKGSGPEIATIIKNEAKKAGINIDIVAKEPNTMMDDRKKRAFELIMQAVSQSPSLDDPAQRWSTKSDTPDGDNVFGFGNAESDKIIEQIRREYDENKRNELYKKFQAIVYEEQPCIFLYIPQERIIINKRFDNAKASELRPGFFENYFTLKNK